MKSFRGAAFGLLVCSSGLLGAACSSESSGGEGGSGSTGAATTGETTTGTTGTATGATSATATTSSATGGGTIDCSDGYSNIPAGECDLLQQDCGAGMTCKVKPTGDTLTTECQSSSGLKGAAEACASDDECQAGLLCINGQCVAVCCPDNDQPCGGGQCSVQLSWNGTRYFTMICSYSEQCELFTEDACPPGQECHIEDTTQGLVACTGPSPQQVDEGGICYFLNDCKDMQFCFSQDGNGGVCRYNCLLEAEPGTAPGLGGCPEGQTCQANYDFGVPGVSICLP
jgi:hypothetical protein